MMLARSVGRPRASLEERTLILGRGAAGPPQRLLLRRGAGHRPERRGAASPVAAAHRILTNSFGLIPFGLYRKEGEERVAVDTPELIRVLKIRPNDYMSPFVLRKVVMSNAFWHGFGAVWNRQGPGGRVVQRIPLPSDCCAIRKDQETGRYWYDYNVDGVRRTFANYELLLPLL